MIFSERYRLCTGFVPRQRAILVFPGLIWPMLSAPNIHHPVHSGVTCAARLVIEVWHRLLRSAHGFATDTIDRRTSGVAYHVEAHMASAFSAQSLERGKKLVLYSTCGLQSLIVSSNQPHCG